MRALGGPGKTRVITPKIAKLLATGAEPKHAAAVTFTNRAAAKMCASVPRRWHGVGNGPSAPLRVPLDWE